MAEIIKLRPRLDAKHKASGEVALAEPAKILLFNGVRYEPLSAKAVDQPRAEASDRMDRARKTR